MHSMDDQLTREGIKISFAVLLAEATFAGNCLTHVEGVTPYHVVYGRQPSMLPPISVDEHDSEIVGATEARVREIALQSMIEATSQARVGHALKASTKLPGETIYRPGDIVEYHRESSQKDVSGWLGPADVLEVFADQGQLLIKHKGEEIRCRFQDARHFIGLEVLLQSML